MADPIVQAKRRMALRNEVLELLNAAAELTATKIKLEDPKHFNSFTENNPRASAYMLQAEILEFLIAKLQIDNTIMLAISAQGDQLQDLIQQNQQLSAELEALRNRVAELEGTATKAGA